MTDETQQSPMEKLPIDTLKLTLSFVANVPDFLSCELACKKLSVALSDDMVWRTVSGPKKDPRIPTHRELANVQQNLTYIRQQQRSTSNIFLDVFNTANPSIRWWPIITNVLRQFMPPHLASGPARCYNLRGDTMGTLLEILLSFLVTSFERALEVCIVNCPDDSYPTLQAAHLRSQDVLCLHAVPDHWCPCLFRSFPTGINVLDPVITRDKIIRGAAFRAGVTKMENDVYEVVGTSLFKFLVMLLESMCLQVSTLEVQFLEKRELASGESIRDVPPHADVLPPDEDDEDRSDDGVLLLTPVPRQLEIAASRILPTFPFRIYNHWLTNGSPEEDEIALAEDEYSFVHGSLVDYVPDRIPGDVTIYNLSHAADFEDDEMSFSVYSSSGSEISYSDESDNNSGLRSDSLSY